MDINDSIEKLELESLSNRYLQQLHENAACSAAVLYTACNFSNVQTSADFWDVVKIRKPQSKKKILGCMDPRCKHESLDSPKFDRNITRG